MPTRALAPGLHAGQESSEGPHVLRWGPDWVSCREPEAVSRVSAWLRARPCGRPVSEPGSWKLTPRASCCPAWRTKSGIWQFQAGLGNLTQGSTGHPSTPLHFCTHLPSSVRPGTSGWGSRGRTDGTDCKSRPEGSKMAATTPLRQSDLKLNQIETPLPQRP